MSTFQGSKAGGWYYLNLSITGCHRIYHFKDFTCITCIPPVSINSGKTHQISPAHFSVFRGFFGKMFGRFSRLAVLSPPVPCIILICFADFSVQAQFHKHRRGIRKEVALNIMVPPPVFRIHEILGWIWIRGSMLLTSGFGFGSGSCYFRH
jgi:hypothetical protein